MQSPATNFAAFLCQLFPAHRGLKRSEAHPSSLIPRPAGTECITQEREPDVGVLPSPVAVLAVNYPSLVRVQVQPDLDHPLTDRIPQHFRLPQARTVDHRIIHIPLEPDSWEVPRHPGVECVMEE